MQSLTAHPLVLSDADARVAAAAADVEHVLAGHSPPVAKLSAIRQLLDEQLGLDMHAPGWPALLLGFLFRHRPGPFTWSLIRLTGQRPRVEPLEPPGGTLRRVTGSEAETLGVADTAALTIWERHGLMLLGRDVAAEVRLRVVPSRVGDAAMARIMAGEPCGEVIRGLTRRDRASAVAWPAEPPVTGSAVLAGPAGQPFGLAGEQCTPWLISRLASPRPDPYPPQEGTLP
jgi:hypothetical protein